MISVTATVVRDGQPQEVPLGQLVPGDVVQLSAGDMIPADLRIISCKDLFVIQSSLTGESLPVEKFDANENDRRQAAAGTEEHLLPRHQRRKRHGHGRDRRNRLQDLSGQHGPVDRRPAGADQFRQGRGAFTWLMIRFMLVMVPLVFLINGLTKHNWIEAFFFALAVAVGLTPEMLPMIVSVCLSRGAIAMSRKKVIVKRLNSIQNLGAMDVLCTDKTGTLTLDRVILERHCDVVRKEDEDVLVLAYLNSHFQTGLKNVLDRAILDHREIHEKSRGRRLSKGRRDPLRFLAQADVGRRRNARGHPPLDLQGRTGGRLPALQPLRVGGQDLSDRSAADRRLEGGMRRPERRRVPRAGDRLQGRRAAGGLLEGRRDAT